MKADALQGFLTQKRENLHAVVVRARERGGERESARERGMKGDALQEYLAHKRENLHAVPGRGALGLVRRSPLLRVEQIHLLPDQLPHLTKNTRVR